MVAGIGRFLEREIAATRTARTTRVDPPTDDAQAQDTRRRELARIVGAVDSRLPCEDFDLVQSTVEPALVGRTSAYDVLAVRWPVFERVDGEGLLLRPRRAARTTSRAAHTTSRAARTTSRTSTHGAPLARIVALPDVDTSPEQVAGLAPGLPPHAQFARRLAELGCEVVVPVLIDRADTWSGNPAIRMTNQPHREFVYRMAFQLGRHIIGYEVQKVLALIDLFAAQAQTPHVPIGVYGYGEGGLLALHAAALDERIAVTGVSGYFRDRRQGWREPIYRNVWRQLRGFGDSDLAALIAPRALVVEATPGPTVKGPPPAREGRRGAAPGALAPAPLREIRAEAARAQRSYRATSAAGRFALIEPSQNDAGPGSDPALTACLQLCGVRPPKVGPAPPAKDRRRSFDPSERLHRQFNQLCDHTQRLLDGTSRRRDALWSSASTASLDTWRQTCQAYRTQLWDDVIGRCPPPSLPPNPRTRLLYDEPRWAGYEVSLDLWPDVFAYGILLVPKSLPPGERHPVVVCQHGLEGTPRDVIEKEGRPYERFAARLADRGYVVYAPQNPYIGGDTFRWLQRRANPLGWSLFSFIVAQHQRTLAWLATLPYVDPSRIAFYGLSYGGKTAMRVPALLDGSHSSDASDASGGPGYCLSICSGDFNEWIVKCASTELPMSYLFTPEWEMFEFDLGNTFNYAEMAYLIAPRPFMVERGHRDGVALDEWVAFEYAKVRRRYADLGIAGQTEIAFFDGPHTIDATATFPFLDRHLQREAIDTIIPHHL